MQQYDSRIPLPYPDGMSTLSLSHDDFADYDKLSQLV